MEQYCKPSVRKQFLTKIYQRNSVSTEEIKSNDEKSECGFNPSSSFLSEFSDSQCHSIEKPSVFESPYKRSATPSVTSGKRGKSPSYKVSPMRIFNEFLTDLLHSKGDISEKILKRVNEITKALNENFAKNPEFSLQFYIAMTGIINSLSDPDEISFRDLKNKVEEALSLTEKGNTEMEQLTSLKSQIGKLSLKVITVKKI